MLLEPNSKVVMIGDSITDAGRDKGRDGEGLFNAYGNGYVNLVQSLLFVAYPERRIRIVNQGTSGHTIRDMAARWSTDVLAAEPDWVSLMIGINDVWRQFDVPLIDEQHVLPDEFRATMADLVARTRPQVRGMVLVTPYIIEPSPTDSMRARMDEYGQIVRDIAAEHNCLVADSQAALDRHLEYYHSSHLAWDRIHPTMTGHMLIARAWLDAVGFDWDGDETA